MKLIVMTLMIFFSFSILADSATECRRHFEDYGTDISSGEIPLSCLSWGESVAKDNAWRMSAGSHYKSLAFENVISYQDGSAKSYHTAGPNTELEAVSAIAFKEGASRIYALLADQGRVLSFDLEIAGNVAPKSVLALDELNGARDLSASEINDEIYILTASGSEVIVLDGSRNINGRKEEREMRIIRRIELSFSDAISLALNHETSELAFLKSDGSLVNASGQSIRGTPSLARSLEWSSRDKGFIARSRGKIVYKVGR